MLQVKSISLCHWLFLFYETVKSLSSSSFKLTVHYHCLRLPCDTLLASVWYMANLSRFSFSYKLWNSGGCHSVPNVSLDIMNKMMWCLSFCVWLIRILVMLWRVTRFYSFFGQVVFHCSHGYTVFIYSGVMMLRSHLLAIVDTAEWPRECTYLLNPLISFSLKSGLGLLDYI